MTDLLSVTRIRGDGYHNAFTDLIHWNGFYYCAFRTGQAHGVRPAGDVIVARSPDLESWSECVRLDSGGDDRDPKFVAQDDRLAVLFGTWFPRWGPEDRTVRNMDYDLITQVAFSRDGLCWSTPRQIYGINYWLWRILSTSAGYYCAAYHFGRRDDRLMRTVHLLHSADLLDWRLITLMRAGGGSGEPALFQPRPDELACVIRTSTPDDHSWLGRSRAPYTSWQWSDLGVMIHAPVVMPYAEGWLVAGRSRDEDLPPSARPAGVRPASDIGHRTSIWKLDEGEVSHALTVPSAGDCGYPGLAVGPDGEIIMTYYSQHERLPLPDDPPTPADVFLARIAG